MAQISDFDSLKFMGTMELPDVPEAAIEQILNETNSVGLRDVDCSNFMEMVELLDVPEELDEKKSSGTQYRFS